MPAGETAAAKPFGQPPTPPTKHPGRTALPFPKKVLYYGLLFLLTLLVIEGMARLAYYLAFDQGYASAPAADTQDYTPPPTIGQQQRMRHPFYGLLYSDPYHELNLLPPRPEQADTVAIALLGGSVAEQVRPYLSRALYRHFSDHNLPRRPAIFNGALSGFKQPQQAVVAAHTLLLGGHFDLVVNLDGFNESSFIFGKSAKGAFPFFPLDWRHTLDLTAAETLLVGPIAALRADQADLQRRAAASPFRYTALYAIVNRYRQEQVARQIIQRHHALAAAASAYSLEKHGPRRTFQDVAEPYGETARFWYRSSLLLGAVAQLAAADYYHFLQPNQYVPNAKPLSPVELANFYRAGSRRERLISEIYPRMQRLGAQLQRESPAIHYFDLTGIFAANPETLYSDACCHFNERGLELLAAAMVERLAPALRRAATADPPVSPLAAAARPLPPPELLIDADFQVYRPAGNRLLYIKDNCAAADLENPFFLHTFPVDLATLPADRREHGFENYDFHPYAAGGGRINGRCVVEKQLRPYPLTAIRTGQFNAAGEIWSGYHSFAE